MQRTRLVLFCFMAFTLDANAGSIYRCSTAAGITYQETPCSAGATERTWDASFPPANTAERDRLLQREAALDARMLKRAELDTAERIAREARYAQEARLEAERERARAAESTYYWPIYTRAWAPRPAHRPGYSAVRY